MSCEPELSMTSLLRRTIKVVNAQVGERLVKPLLYFSMECAPELAGNLARA